MTTRRILAGLMVAAMFLGSGPALAQTGKSQAPTPQGQAAADEPGKPDETEVKGKDGSTAAYTTSPVNVYGLAGQTPVVPVSTSYGTQFNAVSEEQIKQQNSLDFLDALRNVPGVSFRRHNMVGGHTSHSLYIRGRGNSHPMPDLHIYFDDVPRDGSFRGLTLADGIPVYAMGGMEVYKSPQPSRFGNGYGMVNIVPKKMTEEGWELRTGLQAGSNSTFADNLAYGFKQRDLDVYAAQSYISTDGHENHSAANQASYYLNLGYQANENWSLRFLTNYVDSKTEHPFKEDGTRHRETTGWADEYKTQTTFVTFTLANQFDQGSGYFKFYNVETDFDMPRYLLPGDPQTYAIKSVLSHHYSGFRAREILSPWEGSEITAGFDLDKAEYENNEQLYSAPNAIRHTDYFDTTLLSPYLALSQYFGEQDGFHLTPSAGIRYYKHDLFANKTTPQAGLVMGYDHTDLNFNYAKGANYPSPMIIGINNYYSQALPNGYSLDKVKPEVVDHYEVGLTHTWPELATLGVTYFTDDGKDRVQSFSLANGGFQPPLGHYKINGVELSGSVVPIEDLTLFTGVTWLKAKAVGENRTVDKLPHTPKFALQAGLNWRFLESFRLNLDYQHLKGIYAGTLWRDTDYFVSPAANPNRDLTERDKLKDINVVNLRLGYQFDYQPWRLSEGEFFISVDNLFNAEYAYKKDQDKIPYYMPGTTFMAGFDFKFK